MGGCITRLTCGGTLVVGKRVLNDEIPKRKLVAGFTLCFHRAYTVFRVNLFKHESVLAERRIVLPINSKVVLYYT